MLTRPVSLWDPDPDPAPAAVAGPEVELDRPATEEHRWRSQTVTAPIEQMVRAGAHAGGPEDRFADRYDLRRLGHRAIDAVVASMGIARELTDTELIAGLAASAARMAPEAGQDEWQAVAEFVYGHLMNAPDEFAKFSYTGIDPDGRRRPFEFQLLLPRESEAAIAINASPEAINVFLKAFDLDVTDAEVAMSVMLERQINEGRFEAAALTAEAAGRISLAASAKIGELLEDTKRDVGSVDWRGSMRAEVERARQHVSGRILEDDRLLDHVATGTENEDAAIRETSGEIREVLARCKRVHLSLEDRLVRAHRTFLDAQTEQRLARRVRLRLLSLSDQLLIPVLRLPADQAMTVTDAFAVAALGPSVPRLPWLSALIDVLLAPSRSVEAGPRELEAPDTTEEADLQAYSDGATAAARAIFATATDRPQRLSELLEAAREADDPEVIELIWLGSLWAFAPDTADDPDADLIFRIGELTGDLVAEDDGSALADDEFAGADLLLGRPDALAALHEPPAAEVPVPVSLDAYRATR
jgi:hypothetical protein